MRRHWNDDPFTKKARKENYEARSVYKLGEIDSREKIFKGVKSVLDLGASPGSWTQYCLERMPHGKIIAVDLKPLNFTHPQVTFLLGSIEDLDLAPSIAGGKVDMVISDMAPNTSGIPDRDVALSLELATLALNSCINFLKKGGTFVVKVFMGSGFEDYQKLLRSHFQHIRLLRPESTRKQSREIYFVAKEFKGE